MIKSRVISSLHHPLVKHFVKLRTHRDYRYEQQSLILEGLKPIQEASSLLKILYTPSFSSVANSIEGEKWEVSDALIKKISGMESPEGIIAEIRMPPMQSFGNAHQVLALDGINDPGNLGTLLRTALALGWDMVYLLPGTCDPFNDKAVRAARGAHFKIPIGTGTIEELHEWTREKKVQALVADLNGTPPQKMMKAPYRLLVLGNEARGPSEQILQFSKSVSLPMMPGMESLNVAIAGGILLYLLSNIYQSDGEISHEKI